MGCVCLMLSCSVHITKKVQSSVAQTKTCNPVCRTSAPFHQTLIIFAECIFHFLDALVSLDFKLSENPQNVPKLPQITPEVPKIMNLGRTYFLSGPRQTIFFTVTVPFSTKHGLVSFKSLS